MKYLLVILLSITFVFASCDKQEVLNDSNQTELSSKDIQSFSDDLSVALGILDQGDMLEVLSDDEGYEFKITDKRLAQNQVTPRQVRCRGNGLSFAKCVKAAVDEYGCQRITRDGGNYVSSDCP